MESGIYRIINTRNGKCYYGSSKNIKKRWQRHLNDLKNNKHANIILQRIWNKYGNIFKFEIVEKCSDDVLLIREQTYLDDNIGGYNIGKISSGGDNITNNPNRDKIIENITKGVKDRYSRMTEEERKAIHGKWGKDNPNYNNKWTAKMKGDLSKKNKGKEPINKGVSNKELLGEDKANEISKILSEHAKKRTGDKNPFYGKTHSDEFKKRLSKIRKKQGYNGEYKEFEIDGIKYKTLSEASQRLDIPTTTIRWRIKSENKKYENYKYVK